MQRNVYIRERHSACDISDDAYYDIESFGVYIGELYVRLRYGACFVEGIDIEIEDGRDENLAAAIRQLTSYYEQVFIAPISNNEYELIADIGEQIDETDLQRYELEELENGDTEEDSIIFDHGYGIYRIL